jgi:hypothetical protein
MYLRQNLNPINGKPSTKIKKLNGRRPWRMDCGLQSHLNPVGRGGGATLGRGVGAVWSRQLSPVVEGPAGASCRGPSERPAGDAAARPRCPLPREEGARWERRGTGGETSRSALNEGN